MQRLPVTGGTGFTGSSFVRNVMEITGSSVTVTDERPGAGNDDASFVGGPAAGGNGVVRYAAGPQHRFRPAPAGARLGGLP